MKGAFLGATLAIAVALTPTASRADPITGAIASAIFSGLAGAGVAVGLATTIATFASKLIFGVALSLVGQLFAKKPGKPAVVSSGIQTEQTTTGDTTPHKFVLGRYSLEGHAVAPAYSRGTDNNILTYILEVSNIPIKGLTDRIAIDGQWIEIGAVNAARRDLQPLIDLRTGGEDRGWLWFYDGTQTAAASTLVTDYGTHPDRPWTTDHILEGTAYAVLEFLFDQEVFSGLPSVRFEVEGISLYDPRKDTSVGGSGAHRWDDPDTWEYSENPMLIAYNVMRGITLPTGDIYGGQVPAEDLPLDNWFAAMNECDVLIGDRVQFRAGFEVDTNDVEPAEVVEEMLRACFGQISEFGGVFRVRVGAPAAAVMHVTDDDFLTTESMNFDPFPNLAGAFNYFTGTYVAPENIWEGTSLDTFENAAWEAEDGGRRLPLNVGLPAVFDKSQGQHLLESYANDNRRFRVHRLALPPSFGLLEPLDAITWTSEEYGYTDKVFEVTKVEERLNTLVQIVTVRERDAGDVAWTSEQDVPAPVAYNQFTNPDPIELASFAAAGIAIQDADGTDRRPALRLTWDATDVVGDPAMQWQVRLDATQDIVAQGVTPVLDEEQIVSAGIIAGVAYEARGKFLLPRPTQWSAWQDATVPNVLFNTPDLVPESVSSEASSFGGSTTPLLTIPPPSGTLPVHNGITGQIFFDRLPPRGVSVTGSLRCQLTSDSDIRLTVRIVEDSDISGAGANVDLAKYVEEFPAGVDREIGISLVGTGQFIAPVDGVTSRYEFNLQIFQFDEVTAQSAELKVLDYALHVQELKR